MASSSFSLSLYVHVPFCADKCRYCDFFSVPHQRAEREGSLERRIATETIRQAAAFLESLGQESVETIYIGGGTPSVLPRETLDLLLEAFRGLSPAEWTVEANPESLDEAFLRICARRGVSRISAGAQSGEDRHLRLLGRPGDREDNLRAFRLLKEGWEGRVSVDYLCGIPGQTVAELERDLFRLREDAIDHVSLYSLTVERDTALERMISRGEITLNARDQDEEIWLRGKDLLEEMGFRHYEISNFALPGNECTHNLRYWRLEPYLGVGPGAVSTLPARALGAILPKTRYGRGDAEVLRLSNPQNLEAFLTGPENLWGMEIEPIRDRELLMETLLMGLRTTDGIARDGFHHRFGRDFGEVFPGLWERWEKEGAARSVDERLTLTEKGRLFLNGYLAQIQSFLDSREIPSLEIHWP